MIDYQKSYLGKNLNSLSQLGNTLCDGGVDISISGRIGYNCRYKATPYWLKLKNRVDNTKVVLRCHVGSDMVSMDELVAWVDYSETSTKNIKILGLKEHSELLNSAEYLEEEL